MVLSTLRRLFRALTVRARLRLLTSTHPVSAVISLVQVFVARGRFLRTIGLDFFTFTYIVIYVGAIAVLFLFVIMLLDTRNKDSSSRLGMGSSTTSFLPFLLRARGRRFFRRLAPRISCQFPEWLSGRNVYSSEWESWNLEEVEVLPVGPALGQHLYTTHVVDFLLCAMLLLVSMVGSIQISLSGSTFEQKRKSQSLFQQMARRERKTIRFLILKKYKPFLKRFVEKGV